MSSWRPYRIDVADAEYCRQFVEGDDGWVSATSFETADVLLTEARQGGQLLLRKTLIFPGLTYISANQSAHIHAQQSAAFR